MSTDRSAELLAQAIAALTEAARLTRPVLVRDEAASKVARMPVWVDSGRTEPADWAEFVTQALAGAAANVGSVGRALAGRPGSWEADGVRQLIDATVGEHLLEHRTEPVVIDFHVEDLMVDVGGWKAYEEAEQEINRRVDALDLPTYTPAPGEDWDAVKAAVAALPEPTEEQEAAGVALDELSERIEALRVADCAAYGDALRAAVEAAVAARSDIAVPVEVRVHLDWNDRQEDAHDEWWSVADELREAAVLATPFPGAGRPVLERLAEAAEQ